MYRCLICDQNSSPRYSASLSEVFFWKKDKWSVIIIYCLAYETRRYKQLERKIEGISQKVLTQTLRKLEKNGLVKRTVYPVVPPQVEYSLTPLGETLIEPLALLAEWSENHISEVETARRGQKTEDL